MRACIYGSGSLGTALGAYISKGGNQCDLINNRADYCEAINTNGARVVGWNGAEILTAPAKAYPSFEMEGTYDVVFIMTKRRDNKANLSQLLPFLHEDSLVVTMQSGLPERSVAETVGEHRTAGCIVEWDAQEVEPGISCLMSDAWSTTFVVGTLSGERDARLDAVIDMLSTMGEARFEENFLGSRWTDLIVGSALDGVSAITGATYGEVVSNKEARRLCQSIMKECMDVCTAAGVSPMPVRGLDLLKTFDFSNPAKKALSFSRVPRIVEGREEMRSPMLFDLEKGKNTEVEFVQGAVVAEGETYGVETLWNFRLIDLIHRMERAQLEPSFDNIRLLV